MFNLFKIELYKLRKSKMFYFFTFLIIMQGIVVYALSSYGFGKNLKLSNGKETLIYMLSIQNGLALNIITGVFAADYIVTEFSSGYIKNLIYYGHKRINIFMSKAMGYYISVVVISFIMPIVMGIMNTIINGYGEVFNFNSLMFLIRLFFIMSLIQVAIGSIFVLIGFASKNANITMIIVIAIDFINRTFNALMVQKPSLRWIVDRVIFCQTNIIVQDKVSVIEILQSVFVSLLTILVTTAASIYIFKKSDIK